MSARGEFFSLWPSSPRELDRQEGLGMDLLLVSAGLALLVLLALLGLVLRAGRSGAVPVEEDEVHADALQQEGVGHGARNRLLRRRRPQLANEENEGE